MNGSGTSVNEPAMPWINRWCEFVTRKISVAMAKLQLADDRDVLLRQRIDDVGDREADLQVDELAGKLDADEDQRRDVADDHAQNDLRQHGDRRDRRSRSSSGIGGTT